MLEIRLVGLENKLIPELILGCVWYASSELILGQGHILKQDNREELVHFRMFLDPNLF